MKTLFLFSFLMAFSISALAGNPYLQRNNAVYAVIQPGDFGLGLRYDRHTDIGGVYVSLAKGSYRLPASGYIHNHYKGALGLMYELPQKINNPIKNYLSLGLTYHTYGERNYNPVLINENVFKPWSFEAGCGVKINRFIIGIRMDILKWEGSMDFGITF